MGIFKSRLFIAVISFWLGALTPVFVTSFFIYMIGSDPVKTARFLMSAASQAVQSGDVDVQGTVTFDSALKNLMDPNKSDETFQNLLKMQEDVMNNTLGKMQGIMTPFGQDELIRFEEREDDEFYYIDVLINPDQDDRVDIKIEDGRVRVQGQFQRKIQTQSGFSFSRQSMTREFPIKGDVTDELPEIVKGEGKYILKFRKN